MNFFCTHRCIAANSAAGVIATLMLLGGVSQIHAQAIGTTGAANTRSDATPPGGASRILQIGSQIVKREKVTTSESGSVQVLFIDKTTLNIGPNSAIVIDEFVFNPASDSGNLAVTMGRGVLRVVGGQATHTGGGTIRTPVATIGIRGGIATVSHDAVKGTRIINHFGTVTVASPIIGVQVIRRPGFALTVAPAAAPGGGNASGPVASAPTRVEQSEVDATNAQLTSKGGQSGGSSTIPTDQTATRSGLGSGNAVVTPTIRSVQTQTASDNSGRTITAAIVPSSVNSLIQSASTLATDAIAPSLIPPPGPTPAPSVAYALITSRTPNAGDPNRITQAPYLLGIFAASGTYQVSPVLGYGTGGFNPDGTPNTTSRILQTSLNITGAGTAQNATLSVLTGTISPRANFGTVQSAGFTAVSQSNSNANFGVARAQGNVSSQGAITLGSDNAPVGPYIVDTTRYANAVTVGTAFTNAGPPGQNSNYLISETQTRTATPTGLGNVRPDDDLTGYVTAVARTRNFTNGNFVTNSSTSAPYVITNANDATGDVTISLRASTTRLVAQFNVRSVTAPTVPNGFGTAQLNLGSFVTATGTQNGLQGTYIDSQNFGARSQLIFNTATDANVETSSVNGDQLNKNRSGTNDRSNLTFVTGTTANVASFFPGVSFCQCEFTRWGLWSADTFRTDVTGQNGFSDRTGIGTWVAGRAANIADVPTSGTATYNGHVLASISQNGGNSYLAASNFSNTINFGTRTGAVSIPSLDGSTYNGTVNLRTTDPRLFGTVTPITGVGGPQGRQATIDGSLFRGTTSPIGEIGGRVLLTGPGYVGAGSFAAQR